MIGLRRDSVQLAAARRWVLYWGSGTGEAPQFNTAGLLFSLHTAPHMVMASSARLYEQVSLCVLAHLVVRLTAARSCSGSGARCVAPSCSPRCAGSCRRARALAGAAPAPSHSAPSHSAPDQSGLLRLTWWPAWVFMPHLLLEIALLDCPDACGREGWDCLGEGLQPRGGSFGTSFWVVLVAAHYMPRHPVARGATAGVVCCFAQPPMCP